MNVKQIKRKCSVRGCANTNAFSISLTREHGNTVIMCKSCITAALKAVNGYVKTPAKKKDFDVSPPLFFEKPIAKKAVDTTTEKTPKEIAGGVEETPADSAKKAPAKKPAGKAKG